MTRLEESCWVRLLEDVYVNSIKVHCRDSAIVGVEVFCWEPDGCACSCNVRFDTGKLIFIDDIPGVDRHAIPREPREALAQLIAKVAAETPPTVEEQLRGRIVRLRTALNNIATLGTQTSRWSAQQLAIAALDADDAAPLEADDAEAGK